MAEALLEFAFESAGARTHEFRERVEPGRIARGLQPRPGAGLVLHLGDDAFELGNGPLPALVDVFERAPARPVLHALQNLRQWRRLHEVVVAAGQPRSEARRVGKECVSTCRSRWSPYP